jgi:hypothetical protein
MLLPGHKPFSIAASFPIEFSKTTKATPVGLRQFLVNMKSVKNCITTTEDREKSDYGMTKSDKS